ncbi:MAG: tail fiber protein [Solirubrobacteraceae bacterium]
MRRFLAVAIACLVPATPALGADTAASLPTGQSLLFAMESQSGTFTPVTGQTGRYRMVLHGLARRTTWFSDRPQRDAGRITTGSLLGSWRALGFAKQPPNAAVVLDDGRTAQDTVALELRLVGYDGPRHTARFAVRVLGGLGNGLSRLNRRLDRTLPRHFSGASVFIDDTTVEPCALGQPTLLGFTTSLDDATYIPANGELLPIQGFPALFKLYGTEFGGDGQQDFRVPDMTPPLPGMSWQICATGPLVDVREIPQCATGELKLWAVGNTPVLDGGAFGQWIPADGRTLPTQDAEYFIQTWNPGSANGSTFTMPDLAAPPGFAYIACVYGASATQSDTGQAPYMGEVQLFGSISTYVDWTKGGVSLLISQYESLYSLLGTRYSGGQGGGIFSLPAPPSPVAGFDYRTAVQGLYPLG